MNTYHVKLTRDSDGTEIRALLAEDAEGAPSLQLGSFAYSADVAGRPGRIIIPSFHHGSGQKTALDPLKYDNAGGFYAKLPGHLLSSFEENAPTTLTTSYPVANDSARGAIFTHPNGKRFLITPQQIWEDAVLVDTIPGGSRLTGSYAVWGNRTFFCTEFDGSGATPRRSALGRIRSPAGTYSFGFNLGSYLTIIANKLYRLQMAVTPDFLLTVDWTETTGVDDPFAVGLGSAPETVPTQLYAMDMAAIGPQVVIALGGVLDVPGQLLTMDSGGSFTNLLPTDQGFPSVLRFLPWQGGLVVIFAGIVDNTLFFSDLTTFQPLRLHAGTPGDDMALGAGSALDGAPSILVASDLDDFYLAPRQGVVGNTILLVTAGEDGIYTHRGSLLNFLGGQDIVLASRITVNMLTERALEVAYLTGSPRDDLKIVSIPLWNGYAFPSLATPGTASRFTSSEYLGDSQGLKQFLGMGFTPRLLNTGSSLNENLITSIQLNGTGSIITLPTLGLADFNLPVWFEFEKSTIGRSALFSFEFNDPDLTLGIMDIECPIILDYFEVPAARDSIVLGMVAGSLQVTRTGTFTKSSRRQILDLISDAVLNPSRWTLHWWDGRADWQVIPTGFRTKETEGQARSGEGAAIVTLELRHLPDASRVVPIPSD